MQAKHERRLLGLVVALALATVFSPLVAGEKKPSEHKVAVVNGSVITQAAFDREMQASQRRFSIIMRKPLTGSQLSAMKKETLERLIDSELLYQESQKKGIKIDEAEFNRKLKKRFPNEAKFKNILSRMNLTETDLRSQFMRAMAIQRFVDKEFVQKVTVSDKETKEHYDSRLTTFKQPEQVRARHILIKVDSQADESQKHEARKTLERIQQKLKNGEDFSALAKEYSQCPSSAKGGDLGFFRRGQMVKPFQEAAFSLGPGKVSDIVETKFGYHLIKVIDKKPESTVPYEDVKDKIERRLKKEKAQKEVDLYVAKLKGKAKVERFLRE
jgi:peptidyl-prolyl cis-trans isomerase C